MPSVAERIEESALAYEQPAIAADELEDDDAYALCPIAATIDENERRIKAEEARYTHLVGNRGLFEHYMDPFEFKVLMRQASTRLVNFDPAWDLPSEDCPLPMPWLDQPCWSRGGGNSHAQAYYAGSEFACPRPPRRGYH